MKKLFLLSTMALALFACTPKATKSAEGTPKKAESSAVNTPTDAQLTAAKTRFPDVTMEKLKEGHTIYFNGACVNCHGAQPIGNWDEKQWVGILDNMAVKAQLSAVDKDAVWKYIMSVKLASK